jgi:hypothetical protein
LGQQGIRNSRCRSSFRRQLCDRASQVRDDKDESEEIEQACGRRSPQLSVSTRHLCSLFLASRNAPALHPNPKWRLAITRRFPIVTFAPGRPCQHLRQLPKFPSAAPSTTTLPRFSPASRLPSHRIASSTRPPLFSTPSSLPKHCKIVSPACKFSWPRTLPAKLSGPSPAKSSAPAKATSEAWPFLQIAKARESPPNCWPTPKRNFAGSVAPTLLWTPPNLSSAQCISTKNLASAVPEGSAISSACPSSNTTSPCRQTCSPGLEA